MKLYQERVIEECNQLNCRLDKLAVFLSSDVFKSLPDIEKCDLYCQAAAMSEYQMYLNRRIARFDK